MNHYFRLIFLCTSICYATIDATFADTVREKAKHTYVVVCEKTRALYATIKEHKKLIAGLSLYVAFELYGYSQDWDTPLQRLLTPKPVVDNTPVPDNGHTAQIAQLTQAHQQALQEQQRAYQELQQRYAALQNELQALQEKLNMELTQKWKRDQQLKAIAEEVAVMREKDVALLNKWEQLNNS